MTSTSAPSLTNSHRFNSNDSNITIQSSDGVVFGLHQVNMKTNMPWEFSQTKSDEVVQLPEKSVVLDLLFQFCYPERHPELKDLAFDVLAELAEAAEKYKLFSAISTCKIFMKDALPANAFDIFIYGATYGHLDVCQKAAPIVVLQKPLIEVLSRLPVSLLTPWVSYHEQWRHIAEKGASHYEVWVKDCLQKLPSIQPSGRGPFCTVCGDDPRIHATLVLQRLGAGSQLRFLANLDKLFPKCSKYQGHDIFNSWRNSMKENIKNVQPFNARPASFVDSEMQTNLITSSKEISGLPVSARFCAPNFDVTFQSSDGILFRIHKVNLKINSGGFVPPEFETHNEITCLTETAVTLELLFKFCYPDRRPDVEALEFDVLALLAEAAEKYQVFSAMDICKICMKKRLPEHASDILAYAARHDYPDILDVAARLVVVKETLSETLPKLPMNSMLRWVKYYETVNPRSRSQVPLTPFSTF